MGVHNSASASTTYSYDALCRMTYDGLSGLQIEYNHLDLPRKVISGSTTLVNYSYPADGTETSSLKEDGSDIHTPCKKDLGDCKQHPCNILMQGCLSYKRMLDY